MTIPLATYRLQLTNSFGFDDAAAIVPYLKSLGITHLYASPFLKARPGSTHGYDIVDHEHLNPELGGPEAFARLNEALREHGLELIMDFVPNHMGVGWADNAWWLDVLEWGPKSRHVGSFDIDWQALPHRRHPGVLLPILGRPYGQALQSGEIELRYDADTGTFSAWYFGHRLPINPQRYSEMLRTIVSAADSDNEPATKALLTLAADYRNPNTPSYRDAPALKQRLAEIEGAAQVIARGIKAFDGKTEAGAMALHRLLERQNYRVAYWRVAFSAVNYRRFFDINDLAGLRVEDSATFKAIHSLVARLVSANQLHGLRLDHIDGLLDPAQYTRRLTRLVRKLRREAGLRGRFYVIVEKILGECEPIPDFPGVAGTTGYEWLNVLSRVLFDDSGLTELDRIWREFAGEQSEFSQMLDASKQRVLDTILASEFTVLCGQLSRIASGHFSTRDFTLDRLRTALKLYLLEFPVYRTYATAAGVSERDRKIIQQTIRRARSRWPGPDAEIFDFLSDAITLDLVNNPGYSAPRVRNFALKLQQVTGPLMAKAMEDTAFYRYFRLLALNEVGGEPTARSLSVDEFHQRQKKRAESPGGLTATATHDTKRGEDARARILALSEIAAEWGAAVGEWHSWNSQFTRSLDGSRCPTLAHEYMLYQALIGAWPERIDAPFVERFQGYARKAAREGKLETNWINPNEQYEGALTAFIESILDPRRAARFLESFDAIARRTALLGCCNGLSQLALKTLLPGVPDFYQGTEFWNLSLVDPDNRQPVDFDVRRRSLSREITTWPLSNEDWQSGQIKMFLMRRLLKVRHRYADVFREGAYDAVETAGKDAHRVIAFARTRSNRQIIAAVGRHFSALTDSGRNWPRGWDAVLRLPRGRYKNIIGPERELHEGEVTVAKLFASIPVCVMYRM
ncbi:MAG TPA: malto-oligosyltrehalose synthase [Pseudolabrys sp.]|nr:malto-oligosyltrehalose synthase [Pseudolabrys sp.]